MTIDKTTHPEAAKQTRMGHSKTVNNNQGVSTVYDDNNGHERTWADMVAQGQRLVTEINDRKWELGDLANEVCPAGANGVHNGDVLGKFADEIGVTAETLRKYRMVATAWPAGTRVPAQTWTTHRMLAEREDRHEIIAEQTWTYNSLSERLGRLPNPSRRPLSDAAVAGFNSEPELDNDTMATAIRTDPEVARIAAAALNHSDPEVKRDAFRRLSDDREVTDDARTRHAASRNIGRASEQSEFAGKAAHASEQEEAEAKGRGFFRYMAADGHLTKAITAVRSAANEIDGADLTDEQRELLQSRHADLMTEVQRIYSILVGTNVDWDAELANLRGDL